MKPVLDHTAYPQNLALDMDAEIAYWRSRYRSQPFQQAGKPFDRYLPLIKFAYDAYLMHYREELDAVLPLLKRRYARHCADATPQDWKTCQVIIRMVWEHIKDDHYTRCAAIALQEHSRPAHATH